MLSNFLQYFILVEELVQLRVLVLAGRFLGTPHAQGGVVLGTSTATFEDVRWKRLPLQAVADKRT